MQSVAQRADSNDETGLWRLTGRETEVLASMAAGKTNAAIAAELFLTRRAVEKHINSVFSKLLLTGDQQRHARVQAVLLYLAADDRRQPTPISAGGAGAGVVARRTGGRRSPVVQLVSQPRRLAARPGGCGRVAAHGWSRPHPVALAGVS